MDSFDRPWKEERLVLPWSDLVENLYISKSMSFVGLLSVSIAVHYYLTDPGFNKRKIQLSQTATDTASMTSA